MGRQQFLQIANVKRLAQAIMLIAVTLASSDVLGQYVFDSGGANWTGNNRWRIGGVPQGANHPNAPDAMAQFDLPLNPSAAFTVAFVGAPDPITVGHILVNSSAGHGFDTFIGTTNLPGHLTFQTSPELGPATYRETAGASNGAMFVRSKITLLSDLVVTQEHVDSNNLNAGTTFSGMINAAPGITFTKAGNANLNMTNTADPTGGEGFFGSYVINQGSMRFISNSLLGNAAGVTVSAGGQLQIGANVTEIALADGAALTLTGTGVVDGPTNDDGALRFQLNADVETDFNSPIILLVDEETESPTVNINVQLGSGAITARLNKAISGPGGMTKTGGDDLYLAGPDSNTHEGGTGVAEGRLFLNKSGGAIAVPGNLNIGGTSTVVLQQNHQIVDTSIIRFTSTTQQGILRLGGTNRQETVGGLLSTNTGAGIIESNSNVTESLATLTVNAIQTSRFEGLIRDAVNIVNQPGKLAIAKSGVESLELTNANTYSGGTSLSDGALLVNNSTGSGLGTGAVTVSGGTLGGRGFIGTSTSPVAVGVGGGSLNPGDAAAGALTLWGDLTLGSGATVGFDLSGHAAGTEYDQLIVNGAIDLGSATLQLSLGAFTPNGVDSFTLINNVDSEPITGVFSNYGEGDLLSLNGETYAISYVGGDGGNDVVLTPSDSVLDADFNDDSIIDGTDFLIWQRNVAQNAGATNANGDANDDEAVNGLDLDVWQDQFGTTPAIAASAPVPEPGSIVLLGAALVAVSISRCKRPMASGMRRSL